MKVRIEGNKGTDSHVILEVSDTGKGFTEEEKHRIFDRFYQIRKSENIHFEGSGIGLSIVYDLTKLHHGEIEVNSMPGKGSRFIIRIPCEEN